MEGSSRRTALWQIHLATGLLGFTGLFGKADSISPGVLVSGRSIFASLALAVAILGTGGSFRLAPGSVGLVLGSGVVLAVHWYTFFHSIQLSSVSIGLLSFSSYPFFVTLLEPLCFREKLRLLDLWIALLVTAGVALVVPSPSLADRVTQGVCWGLAAGFTCAVLGLLNRALVRKHPPMVLCFYQIAVGALLFAPALCGEAVRITPQSFGLLGLLGVVFTALPQVLTIASLRHLRAQFASIIITLEPVYGIGLAWLLFGEVLTLPAAAGAVLIGAAVLLSSLHSPQEMA